MSAYKNHRIFKFKEGDLMMDRIPHIYTPSAKDIFYTILEGDRLDTLAFKYYGDSSLWYILADVNEIFNPLEILVPGDELIIPGLL